MVRYRRVSSLVSQLYGHRSFRPNIMLCSVTPSSLSIHRAVEFSCPDCTVIVLCLQVVTEAQHDVVGGIDYTVIVLFLQVATEAQHDVVGGVDYTVIVPCLQVVT